MAFNGRVKKLATVFGVPDPVFATNAPKADHPQRVWRDELLRGSNRDEPLEERIESTRRVGSSMFFFFGEAVSGLNMAICLRFLRLGFGLGGGRL